MLGVSASCTCSCLRGGCGKPDFELAQQACTWCTYRPGPGTQCLSVKCQLRDMARPPVIALLSHIQLLNLPCSLQPTAMHSACDQLVLRSCPSGKGVCDTVLITPHHTTAATTQPAHASHFFTPTHPLSPA